MRGSKQNLRRALQGAWMRAAENSVSTLRIDLLTVFKNVGRESRLPSTENIVVRRGCR